MNKPTLELLAEFLGLKIQIRRYPGQKNRWTASFEKCEVKEGAMLVGSYGNVSGLEATPELALRAYAKEIAGKTIVFRAMTSDRQEFNIPEDLQ